MTHTILIVDDHREIINLLTIGLDSLGFDIVIKSAMSGEEAFLEAQFNSIDLLISDVNLPGMKGFELVKNLQKINPDIFIVMLTGRSGFKIRQEFTDLGVKDYFVKVKEEIIEDTLKWYLLKKHFNDTENQLEEDLIDRINGELVKLGVPLLTDFR